VGLLYICSVMPKEESNLLLMIAVFWNVIPYSLRRVPTGTTPRHIHVIPYSLRRVPTGATPRHIHVIPYGLRRVPTGASPRHIHVIPVFFVMDELVGMKLCWIKNGWGGGGGKPKYFEKILPNFHFIHHKSHVLWPGIETRPLRWEEGY
jgi:hypothetical protein